MFNNGKTSLVTDTESRVISKRIFTKYVMIN